MRYLSVRGSSGTCEEVLILAAPQGFEPRYAAPEAAVLPLNEGATSAKQAILQPCWPGQTQSPALNANLFIIRTIFLAVKLGRLTQVWNNPACARSVERATCGPLHLRACVGDKTLDADRRPILRAGLRADEAQECGSWQSSPYQWRGSLCQPALWPLRTNRCESPLQACAAAPA